MPDVCMYCVDYRELLAEAVVGDVATEPGFRRGGGCGSWSGCRGGGNSWSWSGSWCRRG